MRNYWIITVLKLNAIQSRQLIRRWLQRCLKSETNGWWHNSEYESFFRFPYVSCDFQLLDFIIKERYYKKKKLKDIAV